MSQLCTQQENVTMNFLQVYLQSTVCKRVLQKRVLQKRVLQKVYWGNTLSLTKPWDFFGRNDAKAETPVLWPPRAKS